MAEYDQLFKRGAKPLGVFQGGSDYLAVTPANGTVAQQPSDQRFAWAVARIVNTAAAQTATISIYDAAPAVTSLTSLTPIFGPVALGANEVIDLQIPLREGLQVQASAAVSGQIIVSFWA